VEGKMRMLRTRKSLLLVLALGCILGLALIPTALADPGSFTITTTIDYDEWHMYTEYLYAGQQVIVKLTLTDPWLYPPYGIDPDLYVTGPGLFVFSAGPYNPHNPNPAEHLAFTVPNDGFYTIWIYGWWIPPEGAEYTLTAEWGYNIIPWTVEPMGSTRGEVVSFAHSPRVAKINSNYHSAISKCWYRYNRIIINIFTVLTPEYAAYLPPIGAFSTEDHLAVGGTYYVALVGPDDNTPEEAKYIVENQHYISYLRLAGDTEWIPLSKLTKVTEGPPKPDHDPPGVLYRYSRLLEVGFFRPGELEEALGDTGLVEYRLERWWHGGPEPPYMYSDFEGWFWLLPPP
jgi:hypothetical protein